MQQMISNLAVTLNNASDYRPNKLLSDRTNSITGYRLSGYRGFSYNVQISYFRRAKNVNSCYVSI